MLSTFDIIQVIIVDILTVAFNEVTENANISDDLGADSLDTVELVMALEDKFDIEITDEMAEEINTVGDAVKFIDKAIEQKNTPRK